MALSLQLKRSRSRSARTRRPSAAVEAQRELAESLLELRELARGIHPAIVTGHGHRGRAGVGGGAFARAGALDVSLEELQRVPRQSR